MQANLKLILSTLSDKKATDIDVYDFKTSFFIHETMVIASANNPRLLDALSDYLIETIEKSDLVIHHTEGSSESGWILIDTDQILIHLFLEETRAYYQLDVLWADKKLERYVD